MEIKLQEFFYPTGVDYNIDTIMKRFEPHIYTPPSPVCVGVDTPKSDVIVDGGDTQKSDVIMRFGVVEKEKQITASNIRLIVAESSTSSIKKPKVVGGANGINGWEWVNGCDSLFWCIYQHLMITNPTQYSGFGKSQLITQIEEKSRIIEYIQKDIKQFQESVVGRRITKAKVQEILTKLLTDHNDVLDCLNAYSSYYNKKIILYYPENLTWCVFTSHKNDIIMGEEDTIILIHNQIGNGKQKWRLNEKTESINEEYLKGECILMKNYLGFGGTPLGSESSYKKEDLLKIAKILKINMEEGEKWNKRLMYEKINMLCYIK